MPVTICQAVEEFLKNKSIKYKYNIDMVERLTVADFIFIAACLIKLLPAIDIPVWLWIWIAVIAVIKIINSASGFIRFKKFVRTRGQGSLLCLG